MSSTGRFTLWMVSIFVVVILLALLLTIDTTASMEPNQPMPTGDTRKD